MSTFRCTCMDDYTFESVLSLHICQVRVFHKLLKVDFQRKSQSWVHFYFISFFLIINDSLKIEYYYFWQFMQIGFFANFLNLLLTIITSIAFDLLNLIELLQTLCQTILFLDLQHATIMILNFVNPIFTLTTFILREGLDFTKTF